MFLFQEKVLILKILFYRTRDNNFPIKVSLIISTIKKLKELNTQKNLIYLIFILIHKIKNYENKILFNLRKYKISFICLAGYMKIISSKIIKNL